MAFDRNLFLFIELALLKIDSKYTGEMRETLIDMAAKKFVAGEKKNKKVSDVICDIYGIYGWWF